MNEFRKYKPRELMQGLLEGKIYKFDRIRATSRCDFFKLKGDFIFIADLENVNKYTRELVRFNKIQDSFYALSVYSQYFLKEVDEKHAKQEIAKRNKEIKDEKDC